MAAEDDLVNAVGRVAEALGWSMVAIERGGGGIGFVFQPNDSPYGAASSRHRAKQKIAVLSDVMTGMILSDAAAYAESQRILTVESGGSEDDPHL